MPRARFGRSPRSGGLARRRASAGSDLRDLYFGEALYYAHQGHYFEALERLDTELASITGSTSPQLDSLHYHIGDAEFAVGDFELNYRMHHRAGRAIKAVLEGAVDEAVRNEAAFRLARIHFQKDQLDDALHALDADPRRGARGDPGRRRVPARERLHGARPAARRRRGARAPAGRREPRRIRRLQPRHRAAAGRPTSRTRSSSSTRPGRSRAATRPTLAIRDKSNLVLGTMLFESAEFERAQQSLRSRPARGPFSNQALLRAGWAEVSAENFDRALVPWNILAEREPTDAAVQEAHARRAVRVRQAERARPRRAAVRRALEAFTSEIEKVDASIDSIREGRFLKALVREEIRQDKDWVIRLRSCPRRPRPTT